MSLSIASLNSGSNGNCYYIGNADDAVLIDAGLSCKETEQRMKRLGLSMKKVKAIFISHEHTDHIKGVNVLSSKYQVPVYSTAITWKERRLQAAGHLRANYVSNENVSVGSLSVKTFFKHHDACDPHSFTIACGGIIIGVFTDIGQPCNELIAHFGQCHAAFLEANYDDDMLNNGRYPYFLKNRIRGGKGHLSNAQALDIFINHRPSFMSHLLLAHLSKDNNDPELVQSLFAKNAGNTFVTVASRFHESEVYHVGTNVVPVVASSALQGELAFA